MPSGRKSGEGVSSNELKKKKTVEEDEDVFKFYEIFTSRPRFVILYALWKNGPMNMTTIRDFCHTDGNRYGHLDILEKEGLIERYEKDGNKYCKFKNGTPFSSKIDEVFGTLKTPSNNLEKWVNQS